MRKFDYKEWYFKCHIRLVNAISYDEKCVYISTRDENGTKIEMAKDVDEKKEE